MKDEYTEKINYYQSSDYEKLLKDKNILDARQYLISSMVYLNYALITEKLYKDVGKKSAIENKNARDPRNNSVEIMGFHYNALTVLNKFALEWITHISNALDCLLQYINSALHIGILQKNVKIDNITNKICNHVNVSKAVDLLWKDDTVEYIRSVYNYSKHTMDLYGGSPIWDVPKGQRDIHIPIFRYRKKIRKSQTVGDLIDSYEDFLGKYILVLDTVNDVIHQSGPVPNRFYIGEMHIGEHIFGECEKYNDICLCSDFSEDGIHVKRVWIEDPSFNYQNEIEIMPAYSRTIGPQMGVIETIEVLVNGRIIGKLQLCTGLSDIDVSVLEYHRYKFSPII